MERFLERFWRSFWIDFGEVVGEVLERFGRGFWRGFGEILERFLEISLIPFSYYAACRVGKDLGRNLEVILPGFGRFLDSFLNDLEVMMA